MHTRRCASCKLLTRILYGESESRQAAKQEDYGLFRIRTIKYSNKTIFALLIRDNLKKGENGPFFSTLEPNRSNSRSEDRKSDRQGRTKKKNTIHITPLVCKVHLAGINCRTHPQLLNKPANVWGRSTRSNGKIRIYSLAAGG